MLFCWDLNFELNLINSTYVPRHDARFYSDEKAMDVCIYVSSCMIENIEGSEIESLAFSSSSNFTQLI